MKRHIFLFALLGLVVAGFAACTLEADKVSGDGKLEGFWHLESITTEAADSTSQPVVESLKEKRLFWAFQHKLLQMSDRDRVYKDYYCRFSVSSGQLTLTEAYANTYGKDSLLADWAPLAPYGVSEKMPVFRYKIKGGKMDLTIGTKRLHFVKF